MPILPRRKTHSAIFPQRKAHLAILPRRKTHLTHPRIFRQEKYFIFRWVETPISRTQARQRYSSFSNTEGSTRDQLLSAHTILLTHNWSQAGSRSSTWRFSNKKTIYNDNFQQLRYDFINRTCQYVLNITLLMQLAAVFFPIRWKILECVRCVFLRGNIEMSLSSSEPSIWLIHAAMW